MGRKRHGRWVYKTGICIPTIYQEEWYDSGTLTRYKRYDSTGYVSLEIPENKGWVNYRELYADSTLKREGWIIANRPDYRYTFNRTGDYCGPEHLHLFQDFFKTFRFVPAGEWKEYYPSGLIRYTGSFSVDYNTHGNSDTYSEIKPSGKWLEYDEYGNIKSEYDFGKGF